MNTAERKTGVVSKIKEDFGFIRSDAYSGKDIYFKLSWCRDAQSLQEGDIVSFELKVFNDRLQGHYVVRETSASEINPMISSENDNIPQRTRLNSPKPQNNRLRDWAYLGNMFEVLSDLSELALPERWDFSGRHAETDKPFSILFSYLHHTFSRLYRESKSSGNKISISDSGDFAAFNTGLVDRRYEPIYALFAKNMTGREYWRLSGFCIAAEGANGQNLVRNFHPFPEPAHYFDDPRELLYDVRSGKPEMSWKHIIIDNIDRFPDEFVEDNCPPGFTLLDHSQFAEKDRENYFKSLGEAIQAHDRTYRMYISRLRDAVELSIKRVTWNFKTAIPQYYSRIENMQLLLPLCLVSDDKVDLALAVEKTASGSYLAHTIFPLAWAYKNARLICRPDSDWLIPDTIEEGKAEDSE